MKKTIITALLAVTTMSTWAQTLTMQQMLEDYDQLYATLTKNNPYFAVRKHVTDIDIPKEMRRIRHDIDTVTCDGGFYDVIFRALAACNDMHVSPNQTKDSVAMARTMEAYRKHFRYGNSRTMNVFYIDGKYLTHGVQDSEGKVIIPLFSELTHVSGISIDKYVAIHSGRFHTETTDADPRHPETNYKDQVEVEVWPTIDELCTQTFYNKAQHAEEFLYNHEWVFCKNKIG